MIRLKLYHYSKKDNFVLSIRITDGEEPILVTNDFSEVLAKIEAIKEAIPQIGASEIMMESINL